jgi:hypothetical protein
MIEDYNTILRITEFLDKSYCEIVSDIRVGYTNMKLLKDLLLSYELESLKNNPNVFQYLAERYSYSLRYLRNFVDRNPINPEQHNYDISDGIYSLLSEFLGKNKDEVDYDLSSIYTKDCIVKKIAICQHMLNNSMDIDSKTMNYYCNISGYSPITLRQIKKYEIHFNNYSCL